MLHMTGNWTHLESRTLTELTYYIKNEILFMLGNDAIEWLLRTCKSVHYIVLRETDTCISWFHFIQRKNISMHRKGWKWSVKMLTMLVAAL